MRDKALLEKNIFELLKKNSRRTNPYDYLGEPFILCKLRIVQIVNSLRSTFNENVCVTNARSPF
ncbi:hypothetical protein DR864_29630 (plasmid) [Runella rosea]|uniref:Uncharacterized protein n=2 Tax=Runella rosea TaxID=2259595 RepID=A0A344TTQ4_9BACT|nr:hypothetical protein DR864_29630 [Runella rosea]